MKRKKRKPEIRKPEIYYKRKFLVFQFLVFFFIFYKLIFFLCNLRFASSFTRTYNTAVTGIANIIPITPKRLPPIKAALKVQSGASPTEPPTTLG